MAKKLNRTAQAAKDFWEAQRKARAKSAPAKPAPKAKPATQARKPSRKAAPTPPPPSLNRTAQAARDFWAAKAPRKAVKAPEPSKASRKSGKASKGAKGPRKARPVVPRPAPGPATIEAWLNALRERGERRTQLNRRKAEKLYAAKVAEITQFFRDFPPNSHRPSVTRQRIAKNMGLVRFFEIERQYRPAASTGAVRSDFEVILVRPKKGRAYQRAMWARNNSQGVKPGTPISLKGAAEKIGEAKELRGAKMVMDALGVSQADALDIWREIQARPNIMRELTDADKVLGESP